jgi:hypothetical protein
MKAYHELQAFPTYWEECGGDIPNCATNGSLLIPSNARQEGKCFALMAGFVFAKENDRVDYNFGRVVS